MSLAHGLERSFRLTRFRPPVVSTGTVTDDRTCPSPEWPVWGERVERDLVGLLQGLAVPFDAPHKYAAPLFSPAVFRDDRRRLANVETCSMVVLDVDHGATLDEASAAFADHAHVLYTSFSHTPAEHRFRVVLPLSRDVDADTYRRLWRWASERLGDNADRQASDPSRIFFRYCRTPHAEHRVHVDAPLLDVDAALASLPPPVEPRPATWTFRGVELPARPPPPSWRHPDALVEQHRQARRLRDDPIARRELAVRLDARIIERGSGEVATAITCPSCGCASVWFLIAPHRKHTAACNHRERCGWSGPVHDLSPEGQP